MGLQAHAKFVNYVKKTLKWPG